jgi:hypothetical protein
LGLLASHAVGLAQLATQNLERLNRHQLANALGLHLMAKALRLPRRFNIKALQSN